MKNIRLDNLPMNRQAAGYARKDAGAGGSIFGDSTLDAVFEKRDVDPEATLFKRRHGSLRKTDISPNVLGVLANVDAGSVTTDFDFTSDVTNWTVFATLRMPENFSDEVAPIFQLKGVHVYVKYDYPSNNAYLNVYNGAGTERISKLIGDIDTTTDHRIMVRFTNSSSTVSVVTWAVPAIGGTVSIGTETAYAGLTASGGKLELLGSLLTGGALASETPYDKVCISNFLLYNVADFDKDDEYESLAADLTPALTGTNAGSTAFKLRWHQTFTEGNDVLTFTNSDDDEIFSYLVPTVPSNADVDPPVWIHFGGRGVIEIPFYLDFDEYYWTPVAASARLEWMFQVEFKLPNILAEGTIFDFQDILRLDVFENSSAELVLKGIYAGNGVVESTLELAAGGHYEAFVGRSSTATLLTVNRIDDTGSHATTGAIDNPAIFLYDKTLGFIVGDTVDQENTQPFGGQVKRIALHNSADLYWQGLDDAVFHYDISSISGDHVLDKGNRSLNAYLGVRFPSSAPFYAEGGFKGGAYVAATGGYSIAVSTPDINYAGELRKSLLKDATVQRMGHRSFLNSNEVNYVIDDFDKTFRPMGIPRPATKVSCVTQGVGPIDGFVRYAYRWVTKEGTVGPAFDLDPLDATGGVNVFLGAENFGLPGETPFGLSFGECEGFKKDEGRGKASTGQGTVETFLVQDTDGASVHNFLKVEKTDPGLTLELATRIPNLESIKESIFSQGVCAIAGTKMWMADHHPYQYPFMSKRNKENAVQFCFRYYHNSSADDYQVLFAFGARDQHYKTARTHYRVNALTVSIQPARVGANVRSLVFCRDNTASGHHRDRHLYAKSIDYNFVDGHDYCVIVRRGGSVLPPIGGKGRVHGSALIVQIFDQTLHDPDASPPVDGWRQSTFASHGGQYVIENFWPHSYKAWNNHEVMWGAGRKEGSWYMRVKSARRPHLGAAIINTGSGKLDVGSYGYLNALSGGTVAAPFEPGTILYHARIWSRDFTQGLFERRSLYRYASWDNPLKRKLEVDLAFCPDSSREFINGGWDRGGEGPNGREQRVRFGSNAGGHMDCHVVLTTHTDSSPLLAYGWDMTVATGPTPDDWTVESLDKVPMWVQWTSRNGGSLAAGVGRKNLFEIASRKWHLGSKVQLFSDDFANQIDLTEWTWITLYYEQDESTRVWLKRLFIDGMTTDSLASEDTDFTLKLALNTHASNHAHRYGLFSVGGLPGIDQKYETEFAEVRLWDGEYYTAKGGGQGKNAFGPYMSSRLPPNLWEDLWYYLRFTKADVADPDAVPQTTMDHYGLKQNSAGNVQDGKDSVKIFQQARVKDQTDDPGRNYFIPFPTPPLSAIRGIQIFRTQTIPVQEEFPGKGGNPGKPNPNALTDAWKACRAAPLNLLTEIPRGTNFYIDTAEDSTIANNLTLDPSTGLMPRDPAGIFEWEGYLGVYVSGQPRIHFAESPTSWESFPLDRIYDIPLREYGPITAATEIASRDARQSRVLCLGKSWGVYLDGNPTNPQANTLGGGVGATSARCLVVEKGIAYAYNGTLWAITGDGQVEDIGLPVLDLLPTPSSTRLSVSSALSSLFVIDEDTGIVLRYHLSRKQWFVEDRNALSITDIDGVDTWVHISGYPSEGNTTVFQDDVDATTPEGAITVSAFNNAPTNTFVVASNTGLTLGQKVTLVGDRGAAEERDPRERQTVTISAINGTTITVEEALNLNSSFVDLGGTTRSLSYNAYIGVGYWGTMVDTGQFGLKGESNHVDVGVEAGNGWWAAFDTSDFARSPTDRSGFASAESQPTNVIDAISGSGGSARWGLSNQQRFERILVWSPKPTNGSGAGVGLTELELNYTEDPGRS